MIRARSRVLQFQQSQVQFALMNNQEDIFSLLMEIEFDVPIYKIISTCNLEAVKSVHKKCPGLMEDFDKV